MTSGRESPDATTLAPGASPAEEIAVAKADDLVETSPVRGANRSPPLSARRWPGTLGLLAAGLVGGAVLGAIARAWMRWVSTDPQFTWSGTLAIVIGFAWFGVFQALAENGRRRGWRRTGLTVVRVLGVVGILPLFAAAGGVMAPTVILGGLARWRRDWRRWVRVIGALVAAVPPVAIGRELVIEFGVIGGLARSLGLVVVYAVVVIVTGATFRPQLDGWRMRRWVRLVLSAVVVLALGAATFALVGVGR